jgi:hypothetical protein
MQIEMKRLWLALMFFGLASCAHLPGPGGPGRAPARLWNEAHEALYRQEFARADSIFSELALAHPNTVEGREARFYSGALYLDPRNQNWDSERAETNLRQYLELDTVGALIHRRPEGTVLLELARQLNLPPIERVPVLQQAPGRTPATPADRDTAPQRPIARGEDLRALQEEVERLRQQLAQRDEQIRRQREELERIRRALAPRPPSPSP